MKRVTTLGGKVAASCSQLCKSFNMTTDSSTCCIDYTIDITNKKCEGCLQCDYHVINLPSTGICMLKGIHLYLRCLLNFFCERGRPCLMFVYVKHWNLFLELIEMY